MTEITFQKMMDRTGMILREYEIKHGNKEGILYVPSWFHQELLDWSHASIIMSLDNQLLCTFYGFKIEKDDGLNERMVHVDKRELMFTRLVRGSYMDFVKIDRLSAHIDHDVVFNLVEIKVEPSKEVKQEYVYGLNETQ